MAIKDTYLRAWRICNPPTRPTRVGILDTGELILVDATGNAQVITAGTTELIRDVLAADPSAQRLPLWDTTP